MGLLWFAFLLVGVVAGVAGIGGAALASTFMEVEIPTELVYTGGTFYVGAMALMTLLAVANLIGGAFGLLAAVRGFTGRAWGLRTAAVVHIVMALFFGLPGLVTMNPLALIWAAVLVLAVGVLVAVPRNVGDEVLA